MKIRNKVTGEVKEVSSQQLSTYGLQKKTPVRTAPEPKQTQDTGVSATPSIVGQTIGGIAGSPFGPPGRVAGAAIGSGVGQEVGQAMAGQPGDPGAFMSALGPLGMFARLAQKGPNAPESPTQKAMKRGAASQAGGEAIGATLSLFNPKNISGFLDGLTKVATKYSGSKQPIPSKLVENKLVKNIQDFVLARTENPETLKTAEDVFAGVQGDLQRNTALDAEIASIIRKRLGKGISESSGAAKELTKIFYNTLRDVQTELAPAAGPALSLQKLLTYHTPNVLNAASFGAFNALKPTLKAGAGALSKVGGALSRFVLPGLGRASY